MKDIKKLIRESLNNYINEAEGAGGTSGQMFYSTNGGTTWVPFKSVAGVNNWIHDSVVNPAFDNKTDLRFGLK